MGVEEAGRVTRGKPLTTHPLSIRQAKRMRNKLNPSPLASASHSCSETLSTATPESPLRKRASTRMPKTDSNEASYPPNPLYNNHDETQTQGMFCPRSSKYERLEGRHGSSANRFRKKKMFTWKRLAIGAGVLIVLVWLFGPSDTKERLSWSSGVTPEKEGVEAPTTHPTTTAPISDDIELHPPPPSQNQNQPTGPPAHPASFETDSDPSSTTRCTSPHSPGTPVVQRALMIDAGSIGSRIYVYKFNNCASRLSFEYEVFKIIKAAKSLDELTDEA
ncbi:Guanosine-diphosphatase, partial [Marasmius crinis-equi]